MNSGKNAKSKHTFFDPVVPYVYSGDVDPLSGTIVTPFMGQFSCSVFSI